MASSFAFQAARRQSGARLASVEKTTPLPTFVKSSDDGTLAAILVVNPRTQGGTNLKGFYEALADRSDDEMQADLGHYGAVYVDPTLDANTASVTLAFVLGYHFEVTDSKPVIISAHAWTSDQAAEMMQWLVARFTNGADGDKLNAAFAAIDPKWHPRSQALGLRSIAADSTIIDYKSPLSVLVNSWVVGGIMIDNSPGAILTKLVSQLSADGAGFARISILNDIVPTLRDFADSSPGSPGAHPLTHAAFRELGPALTANLLSKAGLQGPVRDPNAELSSRIGTGHPFTFSAAAPSSTSTSPPFNPLAAPPQQLFQMAQPNMGGTSGQAQLFGAAQPGTSLGPDVPIPTRTIPPPDPNNPLTAALANDFLADPTPQQQVLAMHTADLVVQVDGTFRRRATSATSPELQSCTDLLYGSHRMGAYSVATGRWSQDTRLSHDKFIHFLSKLHSEQHRPWPVVRTVYKKFMLGVHTLEISSFGDRSALANLFTFARQADSNHNPKPKLTKAERRAQHEANQNIKTRQPKRKTDDDKDEEKPKRKRWNLLEPFEKDGKTICFDFQLDRCKKGAACARNHVCGICGTAGHTAGKCTK